MRLVPTTVVLMTGVGLFGFPRLLRAQSRADVFDVNRGGGVLVSSRTYLDSPAVGMINGTPSAAVFRDDNGPAGTVDAAHIYVFADHPQLIGGVTLYTLAENAIEDGLRGVSNFRLLASTQGSFGPFDVVLIEGVNPRDDGSPNTYLFPPTLLWAVFPEFTRSTDAGPRVIELDAIGIPEPGAAGAAIVALSAALLRRRSRSSRPETKT